MKKSVQMKTMTKGMHWWYCMVLVLTLLPASMKAQNPIEFVDTIDVDEITDYSLSVTQYELKNYDWIDFCKNPRYAIVTKDGKKGIYDFQVGRNITEIEFQELGYSRQDETVDSSEVYLFYAKKGIKCGILGVCASNNGVFSLFMDDPDEIYSLEECTTIDEEMMKLAGELLDSFIHQTQMENAQIVILDAKSGRLKTWVAMDADMENENAGKLLVHSCSTSLMTPFRDGKPLGKKRLDATCPFMMAVGYNGLAHEGRVIVPTLNGDSVNIQEDVFPASTIANLRDALKVNQHEMSELAWLSAETTWLGYATTDDIFDEKDKFRKSPIGRQIQFAGLFPADAPRYTICIMAEKYSPDATPDQFQHVVNPLANWLLKRN